jgi:hypothetical protein
MNESMMIGLLVGGGVFVILARLAIKRFREANSAAADSAVCDDGAAAADAQRWAAHSWHLGRLHSVYPFADTPRTS